MIVSSAVFSGPIMRLPPLFLLLIGPALGRDDLLVTNPKRISTAIDKKACNGLLLKVIAILLMFK